MVVNLVGTSVCHRSTLRNQRAASQQLLRLFLEHNPRGCDPRLTFLGVVSPSGFHKTGISVLHSSMCVSPSLPMRSCVLAFNDLPNLEATTSNSEKDNHHHEKGPIVAPLLSKPLPPTDTIILSELSGTEHVAHIISIYATLLEDTLCPCLLIQDASCSSTRPSRKCKSCKDLASSMFRDDYYQSPPVLSCCPKLPALDGTAVDDDDSVASYDSLESSPAVCIPHYPSFSEHTTTTTPSPLPCGDESPASVRCPSRFRQS